MNKPNITEGEWVLLEEGAIENGDLYLVNSEDGLAVHDSFHRANAQAISAVPNAVNDYANIIHAIKECKTDSGAVILGDKLEQSIFKTAKKMGFKL